jgi:hypothetical protein
MIALLSKRMEPKETETVDAGRLNSTIISVTGAMEVLEQLQAGYEVEICFFTIINILECL